MTLDDALAWARAFDSNPAGFVELVRAHDAWMKSRADWDYKYLEKLRAAHDKALADSRGWKVYRKTFGVKELVEGHFSWGGGYWDGHIIDHPEWFTMNRRPVAILSHTYAPWGDCIDYAQQHGLAVEQLPYSWYYPINATAALFTRGTP